jgi:hypothetical protein
MLTERQGEGKQHLPPRLIVFFSSEPGRENYSSDEYWDSQAKALGSKSGSAGLDHNKIYTAFFKGSLRQTIPCHLLDLVPVLAQIAGSLLLRCEFGLEAASLATISVRNEKRPSDYPLLEFR